MAALADRKKSRKSLVDDVGSDDGGSEGGCSSGSGCSCSCRHVGNNFGITGYLFTRVYLNELGR